MCKFFLSRCHRMVWCHVPELWTKVSSWETRACILGLRLHLAQEAGETTSAEVMCLAAPTSDTGWRGWPACQEEERAILLKPRHGCLREPSSDWWDVSLMLVLACKVSEPWHSLSTAVPRCGRGPWGELQGGGRGRGERGYLPIHGLWA